MPAKYLVDLSQLSPVEQDELAGIVRHLRALITNLRVYPEGHRVVGEVARRVTDHMSEAAQAHGELLLDAQETTLRCNAEVIFGECPERDQAPMIAAWLRERGVINLLVRPDVTADELLRLFGWLSSTQPRDARESFVGGIPEVLETETLRFNVRVRGARTEELEEYLEEALDSVDLEGAVRHALQDGRLTVGEDLDASNLREQLIEMVHEEMANATASGGSGESIAPEDIDWSRVDLSQVLDPEALEDLVADFMENEFDPRAVFGDSDDLEARLEELAGELRKTLNTQDLGPLQDKMLERAAGAVTDLVPAAVGAFLADPDASGDLEKRVREQVMTSLEGREQQRSEVLVALSDRLDASFEPNQFYASIAAMEEMIPDMLSSPHRADAVMGLQSVAAAAHSNDLSTDCRMRAQTALRALAGPDVVPLLVQELQDGDAARCERAQELLCGLGHEPVVPLLEILRSSLDQDVRMTVVGVLAELGRRERAAGATAPRSMVPLLRELRNADHNPWYFTRNLAEVLHRVAAPGYDRDLLNLLGSDLDYRVRAAVAQGLASARSDEIQAALRQALFQGKIIVPEAFQELLGRQLVIDRDTTLREFDGMLTSGEAPDRIERVGLATLARQLGSDAVPFLARVLTARSGILRRPTFGEELRLTAVEALGTVKGDAAREALRKASKDPSEEVRRRAALRLEQGPSSSPPGSSSQEVPWA